MNIFLSATFSCLFSSTFSLVLFFYKFFEHIFMFLLIIIIIQAKSNILLTFISYLCAFFLSWHSNFIRNFNSTKYLFAFFSDRFIAITTNTQMSLLIPTKFRQKQKKTFERTDLFMEFTNYIDASTWQIHDFTMESCILLSTSVSVRIEPLCHKGKNRKASISSISTFCNITLIGTR